MRVALESAGRHDPHRHGRGAHPRRRRARRPASSSPTARSSRQVRSSPLPAEKAPTGSPSSRATLGLTLVNNAVDIGVRVECPAPVMERLTDALYEAKLVYRTKAFGDTVRTFCMNPHGEVTTESYGDVVTVNGHSYAEAKTALHQLRGAREPALHRAVPRPDHLRPLDRQAREPARRRHPRAAARRPEGRPSLHARAHRAVARRADARAAPRRAICRRCCRTGT